MTCYIVGAAPQARRISPQQGDFVIAADGGLDHLARWGLRPDWLVGDMDSVTAVPQGIPLQQHPREKDDTDLALALQEGCARGFRNIIISGAWGGRPDHSFGSLQLLAKAARTGCGAQLLCDTYTAAMLPGGSTLQMHGSGIVSVFAYGGAAQGVTIRGLQYPLENAALQSDTPLGTSNCLAGKGSISLEQGTLLVFWQDGIQCHLHI